MVKPCGAGSAKGREFLSGPARALLKLSSKLTILCPNLEWLSFDSERRERESLSNSTLKFGVQRVWLENEWTFHPVVAGMNPGEWPGLACLPCDLFRALCPMVNFPGHPYTTNQIPPNMAINVHSTVWLCLRTPCLLVIPENTSLWSEERCLKNFYYHYDRSRLKHSVS